MIVQWRQEKVPDEWKAIIVSLHKDKSSKNECSKYQRISLFSVLGKLYGKVWNETDRRVVKSTMG